MDRGEKDFEVHATTMDVKDDSGRKEGELGVNLIVGLPV